jgi:hypothetical protein
MPGLCAGAHGRYARKRTEAAGHWGYLAFRIAARKTMRAVFRNIIYSP